MATSGFKEERFLTIGEVADRLRKHEVFVRNEVHGGRLRAFRIGAELRILPTDLESYLASSVSKGPDSSRRLKSQRR